MGISERVSGHGGGERREGKGKGGRERGGVGGQSGRTHQCGQVFGDREQGVEGCAAWCARGAGRGKDGEGSGGGQGGATELNNVLTWC